MYCENCGSNVDGMKFCSKCGTKIEDTLDGISTVNAENKKPSMKNVRMMGYILALSPLIGIITLFLPDHIVELISGGVLGLGTGLWIADRNLLKNCGYTGKWTWWGLVLTPVYLYFRDKKTNQKKLLFVINLLSTLLVFLIALIITLLSASPTSGTNNGISSPAETVSSQREDINKDDLPSYSFMLEGYVEIQPGEIDEINVKEYLPSENMTLTYTTMPEEKSGISEVYYVEPNLEENKVAYVTESQLVEGETFKYGYYHYNTTADCLSNETTNILGGKSNKSYLIPMGKSLEVDDGVKIQNVTYLFTVRTSAGTYKDCVCVLKQEMISNRTYTTATYYAKGIGEVLSVSNMEDVNTFVLWNILSDVEFENHSDEGEVYNYRVTDTQVDIDMEINSDEPITVEGIIRRNNGSFPDYYLELSQPMIIKINDTNNSSSETFECSKLYFYNNSAIDYKGIECYLTDNEIGRYCTVYSVVENYRGGGELFFDYPEIISIG